MQKMIQECLNVDFLSLRPGDIVLAAFDSLPNYVSMKNGASKMVFEKPGSGNRQRLDAVQRTSASGLRKNKREYKTRMRRLRKSANAVGVAHDDDDDEDDDDDDNVSQISDIVDTNAPIPIIVVSAVSPNAQRRSPSPT